MKIPNTIPGTHCLVKEGPKNVAMVPVERQKLEHAKVCLLSEKKMSSIENWLTRNEAKKKDKEREEAYSRYLKDNNFKLVGGKTIVKEEALKRLIAKEHEDIEGKIRESYKRIKEHQIAERDEIIRKHRRLQLINKSHNVVLTSALRHCETLYERQKHYALQQQIKEEEKKFKQLEHEEMLRKLKIAEDKEKQEEKNRQKKTQEVKDYVKIQCQENERRKQEEYTDRISREKDDLIKSQADWEERERIKQEDKMRIKNQNYAIVKEAIKDVHIRKMNEKKEEEEIYRVNEVINNSKAERDCYARQKLKKEKLDRIRKNVDAAIEYQTRQDLLRQKEEEIFLNAIREYEEEHERKHKEKIERLKTQAIERKQNYVEDMKRKKEKEREISELKRMEMIERYKREEVMKHFDEMTKQKEIEKKRIYKEEIIQQALDIKEAKQREKKLEDDYILSNLSKTDNIFAEYAEEVLEYAKERDWPTFPIKKAIRNHNKIHNGACKKPNDCSCKNH